MDSENVSLKQILDTIQSQAESIRELKTQVTNELSELKQEVHGSSTQVKKFKSSDRIQFVFNSEISEELSQRFTALMTSPPQMTTGVLYTDNVYPSSAEQINPMHFCRKGAGIAKAFSQNYLWKTKFTRAGDFSDSHTCLLKTTGHQGKTAHMCYDSIIE